MLKRITSAILPITTQIGATAYGHGRRSAVASKQKNQSPIICWAVTGTYHGALIYADSEGEARRIFHKVYNGESIIHIKTTYACLY